MNYLSSCRVVYGILSMVSRGSSKEVAWIIYPAVMASNDINNGLWM